MCMKYPWRPKTVLSGQVARPGRPPGEGTRRVADGQGPPVPGAAACSAGQRWSVHARVEPGFRVARLRRGTASGSGSRQRAGYR